ncbi:uncharacterized protein LOC131169322 [Hevea brasiliensis]|uniref:uncharacterized protein LOC131169322 n=1 Tax=Hevea brasiliensis TaxID=3981 RepID=UPI0025EAF3C4|nr:uncharacterized protein LOC131169322 [Hevea brasiliensis]
MSSVDAKGIGATSDGIDDADLVLLLTGFEETLGEECKSMGIGDDPFLFATEAFLVLPEAILVLVLASYCGVRVIGGMREGVWSWGSGGESGGGNCGGGGGLGGDCGGGGGLGLGVGFALADGEEGVAIFNLADLLDLRGLWVDHILVLTI